MFDMTIECHSDRERRNDERRGILKGKMKDEISHYVRNDK